MTPIDYYIHLDNIHLKAAIYIVLAPLLGGLLAGYCLRPGLGAALDIIGEQALVTRLGGRRVDVVVSDMAPNLSGIASVDAARVAHLVELAVEFALHHLQPEGALVCKTFHGSGYAEQARLFKESFRIVKAIKPRASRDKSSETFLVGLGPKRS